jgi:hypothetical protein
MPLLVPPPARERDDELPYLWIAEERDRDGTASLTRVGFLFPVPEAPEELAREESADQNRKGRESPPESREDPQRDNPGDRDMHCEKPGCGKFFCSRPPETERQVQEKHGDCDYPKIMHS